METVVRLAGSHEAAAVLAVLNDAARWLAGRGVAQWPAAFRPEWIEPFLGDGNVWLAEQDGVAIGTLTLAWTDPLWPDDARAGYVHRLAVVRAAAGLGAELLLRAERAVRDRGRDLLRLDCAAGNARLRAYYEATGFGHRGDVEIPGAETLWSTGRPLVSRYERPVGRPTRMAAGWPY